MEVAIRCHELFSHLADDDVLVVDCRDPAHWSQTGQHIPGALRMTLDEVLQYAESLPDDELVVLCSDASTRSACGKVARVLRRQGVDAVCLEGGFERWFEEGLPTESHHNIGSSWSGPAPGF